MVLLTIDVAAFSGARRVQYSTAYHDSLVKMLRDHQLALSDTRQHPCPKRWLPLRGRNLRSFLTNLERPAPVRVGVTNRVVGVQVPCRTIAIVGIVQTGHTTDAIPQVHSLNEAHMRVRGYGRCAELVVCFLDFELRCKVTKSFRRRADTTFSAVCSFVYDWSIWADVAPPVPGVESRGPHGGPRPCRPVAPACSRLRLLCDPNLERPAPGREGGTNRVDGVQVPCRTRASEGIVQAGHTTDASFIAYRGAKSRLPVVGTFASA